MVGCGEDHAVVLYRMYVPHRRGEGNVSNCVGFACFQHLDGIEPLPQVIEQYRLGLEGISWGKQPSVTLEPTLSHRLDHDVNIGSMVKVAVGDDNRAEILRLELSLGCLDDAAGPGVNQYLGAAEIQPQATRRQNLGDYHESGATSAEKCYSVVCLFLTFHAGFTIADSRSYYNGFDLQAGADYNKGADYPARRLLWSRFGRLGG